MATDADYVKARAPRRETFADAMAAAGVALTLDEAIADVVADYAGEGEQARRCYALADLWEMVVADDLWQRERALDTSGEGPLAAQRAAEWRARGDAAKADASAEAVGTLQSVPITRRALGYWTGRTPPALPE